MGEEEKQACICWEARISVDKHLSHSNCSLPHQLPQVFWFAADEGVGLGWNAGHKPTDASRQTQLPFLDDVYITKAESLRPRKILYHLHMPEIDTS